MNTTDIPENMFLTPDEIETLTGYTRNAEQLRELRSMGIKCFVNRLGRPVIMRETLLARFGNTQRHCMPDLTALEAIENGTKA